jgi:class 3 adenylate cyclase/tetratricopeptide (TPR) repeat protein
MWSGKRELRPDIERPPPQPPAEIACPSCGAANPQASRFCGACGTSLERACPSCGATNPLGNRFCGSCGTSLGEPGAGVTALEERKVVTVLFADLNASTEMASRLDPEDLRAVIGPYFAAMAEEVDRFGGTVEKFIGDAVVAVFGAPAAHEDDPERAVRCALAMQRRLRDLSDELSGRAGGDLAMRIGVNTGDVIAHADEEGIVTGEAVNIAARFQALAEPGSVVVGERTHRDTRNGFGFHDLGEVTVKGIERPLRVWRVDGEAPAAAAHPGAGAETPFVGREQETELLRLLFERTVRERRPNLVTIVGPPGIGKSRLARETTRTLGGDGVRVLRGRCLPYGEGLTYWPLAEILKADAGIMDSDPPATILEKAAARLDPRFPGDQGMGVTGVLLSSIGVEVASDPLAGTDPDAARRVIARAWQRYLESMTGEGPVIALIEDIHWADPSLLELVESCISRASGPIIAICMARPELFQRRPTWGGGVSNATTISLTPLSAGDGTALIQHLLDGEAPAEVVGAILHRSEGNPFFAEELLRMMIEDGTLGRRDGRWSLTRELPSALPDTVQGVIASRLDLLPPSEKRVVQDASVIGRVFWRGGIERLEGGAVDEALDGLLDKGIIRARESSTIAGEQELIFHHVLTRDVAYASIPRARRTKAHAIVGEWIEEGTRGRHEEFAELLAYHVELAGDAERTARYALLAGNRHLRVFAAEQAIEWYERALAAAPKRDAAIRSRICLARGEALEQLGRFPGAIASLDESVGAAHDAGDVELEARTLAAKAHVLWLVDRYDEGQALLPEALERARAAGLADVEARLLYTAGTIRFGRGEFAASLPMHERALQVAAESGDLEGQALAHHGLCESLFFTWPIETALVHGETADRMLRELGQRSMVAHNAYMVSWALGHLGRWDEAMATVNASIQTSHEIGNRREEAFALYNRAELFLSAGRLEEAWRDGDRGRSLFREIGTPRGEIVGCGALNDVAAEAGAMDRLAETAAAALALSDELGSSFQRGNVLAYAGWAALLSGDREEAERRFAGARANFGALEVAWVGAIEVTAREWAADPAGLRSVASRIRELVLPRSAFWGAWGVYGTALADLLDGDEEASLAGALTALDLATRTSEHRLRWRSSRVAWKALQGLGRTEEAEPYRARAMDLVRSAAEASGELRESFLARPEVAELLA